MKGPRKLEEACARLDLVVGCWQMTAPESSIQLAYVIRPSSDIAEPSGSSPKRMERSSCQSCRTADSDATTPSAAG